MLSKILNGLLAVSLLFTALWISASEVKGDQLLCMQQNVFFEARNQSEAGQEAVAWVTLNRVRSPKYPNTICEVVWQNKQFSWTHDGKADLPSDNVIEQASWKRAGEVAKRVIRLNNLGLKGSVGDSIMYHADYVNPYWADSYEMVTKIDKHIFYR